MLPRIESPADRPDDVIAFIAELIRLQSEVRKVGQELDRVEFEMRQALVAQQRDRFEEYR
jgi:hypothetical protein